MINLPKTTASFIVAATVALTSASTAFATDIYVVDPISGETISVTDVSFSSLTEDQRQDVGDQLAEQGYRVRPSESTQAAPEDLADVTVVDPTSGETVALSDVDVDSLSDDDRRSVGDQLAEQGANPGRGGRGGRSNN